MNITIIGLGLIGGSLAKAFKSFNKNLTITAYDRKDTIESALDQKIIDKGIFSLTELAEADIIFIALPISDSLDALKQIAPFVKTDCIISDVCSVKGIFEETWKSLSSKGYFIGGHPMTGKEKSGYENSDPLLFENAVYILCGELEDSSASKEFLKLLYSIGAKVKFLSAEIHDKITAKVSHLPQIVAVALVNAITGGNNNNESIEFSAGGFRDMTRIASSPFGIWKPILFNNKENILDSIDEIILHLNEFKELLLEEDSNQIEDLFNSARYMRDAIPRQNKGFLNPVFDLYVSVKDEPGVLSKLTTLLYNNNINIKDMELLKIREGAKGTFRLSFESETAVELAKKLLEENGFIFD
ncbi:MAG: prephenate dehydrogenase [Ignavibacteria bacterium]|nr:prephenate dehydrogenase [Ignavibacteria bacterium]MDP3830653.1 prephenate dehydrogenase [Ignavibacteriaceae bacterium]